jgi:hypothetical protein
MPLTARYRFVLGVELRERFIDLVGKLGLKISVHPHGERVERSKL